jgi:hypothetical protein
MAATGVEREYNDQLAGQTFEQELRSFADLVDRSAPATSPPPGDDVQRVARISSPTSGSAVVLTHRRHRRL